MGRINKFRAWGVIQKRYFSAKELSNDGMSIDPNGRGLVNISGRDNKFNQYFGEDKYILEQFIEIEDKSGQEIYEESDIVRVKIDDVWYEGIIKWENTSYVLEGYGYLSRVLNKGCSLEIVGNIHEGENNVS